MARKALKRAALIGVAGLAALAATAPASAQTGGISLAEDVHAGELAVPVNKSQVLRSACLPEGPHPKTTRIADVLRSPPSLYGSKRRNDPHLTFYTAPTGIAVVDVVVRPDVTKLRATVRADSSDQSVRNSHDAVASEAVSAPRRPACRSAGPMPGQVVTCCRSYRLSRSASKSALLVKRAALNRSTGLGSKATSPAHRLRRRSHAWRPGALTAPGGVTTTVCGDPVCRLGAITTASHRFARLRALGANFDATPMRSSALVRKTLANRPWSRVRDTASFLPAANSRFRSSRIPEARAHTQVAFTVEWKPFRRQPRFTPTVLADGV